MAEGLINVDNAANQERLARQELDGDFTHYVEAARNEAESLPGLGRRLQHEWAELLKVAAQLPGANGAIASEVDTAHRVMTGGIGTEDFGVAHHALDIIQGPEGSQTLGGRARRALKATMMLALLTPESREWVSAQRASEDAQKRISALGGLVKNVVDSTAKVPKDRFNALTEKAADASDNLRKHIGRL